MNDLWNQLRYKCIDLPVVETMKGIDIFPFDI